MFSIEHDLLVKFQRIDYWWGYSGDNTKIDKYDSLHKANTIFQEALTNITSKYSESLNYDFKLLKRSGLTIATSDDHRLRIYSWDTNEGGTMHFFLNVYQWMAKDHVYSKAVDADAANPGDPGVFCTPIYTFHTPIKTYYLVINSAMYSTKDTYESVQSFCIGDKSLNDSVRIFKTQTGLNNSIGFSFDFFSVVDRPERPLGLIRFDPARKQVRIPLVFENGTVTHRSIVYTWTGKYFERRE
jgi:hypothetical protein